MKKISLFYLLFALSSFYSLGSMNNYMETNDFAVDRKSESKGFYSWFLKPNEFLDRKSIGFISLSKQKSGKGELFLIGKKIQYAQEVRIFSLGMETQRLDNAFKALKTPYYIQSILFGGQLCVPDNEICNTFDPYGLNDSFRNIKNENLKKNCKKALKRGKGFLVFKDKGGNLKVQSFDLWEFNYRGIGTLLGIVLALFSVLAYSLDFFSSSETENEIKYIT